MLAGPVVWAANLQVNYTLSYVSCEQRHSWMLHLTTLASVVLIGLAALALWRARPGGTDDSAPSIDPRDTAVVRARFMVVGGLAFCAFFALVILATDVPVLVLKPCTP